ncbi:MAG: transporter [Gallionellales bacterium 35-53-114]|jgi:outer membrane protein TolC|nr:MAG: transporter [Gallionellales bacterium 35-53-114]OYZ64930.1 MAG: transporter [Gallionellales bacterium 24-53-125]OZB07532.1 MAG: transporter [Gallionellales bacterium 39-52-133]HQS58795.1 TolC family protein [Gallionellaceae bacterium]HQS75136.1 TolC family protein [Gallionellaceae bacterium]
MEIEVKISMLLARLIGNSVRILWVWVLVFSFSLFGCVLAQAANPPPLLTLESALREAETRSHALQAQDAATRSALEMAVSAGRLPDPMLRLSVDNLPVDGPMRYSLTDDFMTMRSVGLTQTFTSEDKRHARSSRFEREGDAAQAMRTLQLSKLRQQTALAWFDRYYQLQMLELLTKQRDETALQIEAAAAANRSGRGAQADVFAARSAVARMDDRIQETRARAENAGTTLSRWVGELATSPLGSAPDISRGHFSDHKLAYQMDQHPDIGLLTSKIAVAQAEAEIAKKNKHADWSVSLMYSHRGPEFSEMATVVASIPLQWDQENQQDRELSAKLAKVEQARDEREEMVRTHYAQTQAWLTTWQSNLKRLDQYDKTLIVLAKERTRAALAAYRGGKLPLLSVLDARRMEIDTQVERLRIEMQTAALWTSLEYLISNTTNQTPQKVNQQEHVR